MSSRKHLTLQQKAEALAAVRKGVAINRVALNFGVNKSIISRLNKNKQGVLSNVTTSLGLNVKKGNYVKRCEFPEMERQLYQWFINQREKQVPISGAMLKERALAIHNRLDPEKPFSGSEGWLTNFKRRHGI